MTVEFIPAAHVREVIPRIEKAREQALEQCAPPRPDDTRYWESLFEANAAHVLAVLPDVRLADGCVVRYRFFGQRGSDLLVRPFVARATTDVDTVRQLLDWHAPPDAPGLPPAGTQDVELLYRHFSFPQTAIGAFDYWLAMQELWASARWAHAHVIASVAELSQITAAPDWEVLHPVEAYEPAVVGSNGVVRLAVLIHSPLQRFAITLEQIEVGADQSLRYGESILVASGPRGYAS